MMMMMVKLEIMFAFLRQSSSKSFLTFYIYDIPRKSIATAIRQILLFKKLISCTPEFGFHNTMGMFTVGYDKQT